MTRALLLLLPCAALAAVRGTVTDAQDRPVPGAVVTLGTGMAPLAAAETGNQGEFTLPDPPGTNAWLRVQARAFEALETVIGLPAQQPLRIRLSLAAVRSSLTVTATRGSVEEESASPRMAMSVSQTEFLRRPLSTLGHALAELPGAMVQQTTSAHASPFLRGLTGYQTLLLVDGVRYNVSTFRSGPNQYLAYADPSQMERMEVVLGPSSSAYGSDALGGAVNMLTLTPRPHTGKGLARHGSLNLLSGTADASATGSARLDLGTDRWSLLLGGSGRRHNNLRAGGGLDSRNVLTRYFGLSGTEVRDLLGSRLPQTAFTQPGAIAKFALRPDADQSLTINYQRGVQSGSRNHRDIWGGQGRLISEFAPQSLDFFYTRYEKARWAGLDTLSGTFSVNSQTDGSRLQAMRRTDTITDEESRTTALGYTAQAATHAGGWAALVFGGEVYHEGIAATRFDTNPATGAVTQFRAVNPNGSRYLTQGLFAQSTFTLWNGRLRILAGGRFTRVTFATFARRNITAAGRPLGVVDTFSAYRDLTGNLSGSLRLHRNVFWHVHTGRGFRAPNVQDLGSLGRTDQGFEVPAETLAPLGAFYGVDASEGALSSGRPVASLSPERATSLETGLSFQSERLFARTQVFGSRLADPIIRRTALFSAANVPSSVAGFPVTLITPTPAHRAAGLATVATEFDPRALKVFVNDGRTLYYGAETMARYQLSARWQVNGAYSFLAGRDLNPNRPVRRLPPQQGSLWLRFVPSRRSLWIEAGGQFSGAQRRLNNGDIDDERIGASRRRQDIAALFQGDLIRPFIRNGVFVPTGETLAGIQNRVLPLGAVIEGVRVAGDATRVPLFRRTPGWLSMDVRGGAPLNESITLMFGVSNLFDRNYRTHASGVDSPGRSAYVGIRAGF